MSSSMKKVDKRKSNKGEEGRNWLRGESKCYCPNCKAVFTYEEMWKSLVSDLLTVWDIVDTLKMSWPTVRKALRRFNLEAYVIGTKENNVYQSLSNKLGFDTARSMFIDFIKHRMSFKKIGSMIDKDKKDVKVIC